MGDAVGVRLPDVGILRPATPPPDFDLDQALTSLQRFADRPPGGHRPGPLRPGARPAEILDEAEGTLRRWAEVAEAAWRKGGDIAAALDERFAADLDGGRPAQREKLETLNGIHSNAAGFRRWLDSAPDRRTSNGVQVHHHPHD